MSDVLKPKAPILSHQAKTNVLAYFKTAWPILVLMLLVGISSYLVIDRIARSQDQDNATNSRQLLNTSLESLGVINLAIAKELSIYKGAYENITLSYKHDWVQENFQSPNTTAVLVYSANGGLVHSSVLEQYKEHRQAIETIAREVGHADANRENEVQLTNDFKRDDPLAFVLLGGYIAAVSSQPIKLKSAGIDNLGKNAKDHVITVKYLGEYQVETIGRTLGLKQLTFVGNLSAPNPTSPKVSLAIYDTKGKTIGWFEWLDEKRGTAAFQRHLWPISSGLVFFFILTAFVTRQSFRMQLSAQDARVAAEAASNLKSTFLANMSHELRTPLNAIIGYSEMLAEDCTDLANEAGAADANIITRSAHHLLALINDLLDHSKIEAGKMDLDPKIHSIRAIIDDVADTLKGRVAQNDSKLLLHCDPLLGEGLFDAMRLKQCLLNLVSNAAKFTKSGTITISARPLVRDEMPFVMISIKDTGIGMSENTLKKLFSPFIQADATTAQNFGGTGLGLAITKKLIAAMGGTVGVESALNEGSTFTLLLPRGMAWVNQPSREPDQLAVAA